MPLSERLADLDRAANAETIRNVAADSRARLELDNPDPSLRDVAAETFRQLRHWRPDIPRSQIREVLGGAGGVDDDA